MQQLSQILPRALHTRLPARSRLTVVVIVLAAAIAVPLALSGGGHGAAAPKPGSSAPASSMRYDRGPEEGTADVSAPSPTADIGARLDHRGLKYHAPVHQGPQ
jgi:hypothetical protein